MPGAPIFDSRYSTTDVNKSGARVYDDAWVKGGVQITRRGQNFVLLRQDYLETLIQEAQENRPKSLNDLLHDYDADKIKTLTTQFMNASPTGNEII